MSGSLSARLGIVVAIAVALCTITFAEHAVAQAACPAGNVPATAADIPAMQAAGIPNPTVGMCWNPNSAVTGEAAGQAKQFLQQHAIHAANISCLNTQFAEQVQKMVQAIPSNLGTVLIDSGYRTPAEQAALPSTATKVGACGSYHNYGLAADFNYSSKQVVQWIRANASQYGLAVIGNPATGCFSSGFCDPAHVQESGSLPSSNQCGICSSTGGGGLQPNPTGYNPNSSPDNNIYSPPSSGGQAPAGYCLVSTQPIIYTPCNGATTQAQPTPIAQPLQAAPTTATTPAIAPTVTPSTPLSTATSSSYNPLSPIFPAQPVVLPVSPTPTSTQEFLQMLLNPSSATSATSSIWSSFNTSIYTIVQGELGTQPQSSSTPVPSFTGTNDYAQETLTMNNTQTFSSNASFSPLSGLLDSLKGVLGSLLSYLQSL